MLVDQQIIDLPYALEAYQITEHVLQCRVSSFDWYAKITGYVGGL